MCLVLVQSLGSLASLRVPELSSKTLQYTWVLVQRTLKSCSLISSEVQKDDIYGASNIVLPCPGSYVIFHLVEDVVIILKSSI
jgi:hypothetical protein